MNLCSSSVISAGMEEYLTLSTPCYDAMLRPQLPIAWPKHRHGGVGKSSRTSMPRHAIYDSALGQGAWWWSRAVKVSRDELEFGLGSL